MSKINGFEQMKSFYSWVFENPDKARATIVSLYMFFLNQNNRAMWTEWFKCPYDLAMQGGCIGSKSTYYNCLKDMQKWGLIKYKQGENLHKAPLIKLIYLSKSEPLTVPLSEQVTAPLCEPLSGKYIKLITDNLKLITDNYDLIFLNLEKWVLQELEENSNPLLRRPKIEEFVDFFKLNGYTELSAENAWHYYVENNWKDKSGKQVKNWKIKVRNNWFKPYNKSEEETKEQQQPKPKELPISKLLRRDFETNAKYLLEIKRRGEFPDIFDFSLSQDLREGKSEETILIEEHEMKLKHPKGLNYEGF